MHGLSLDVPNTRDETLHIAVLGANDTDMAHWLVDRGADVRVMDRLFCSDANSSKRLWIPPQPTTPSCQLSAR